MRLAATFAAAMFCAAAVQAAPLPDDVYVMFGKDVADTAMTAKADGATVKYTGKIVPWATGTVKVLTFTKAGGGVLHPITDETEIYVLKGEVKANVGGQDVTLGAGDVATHAKGMLRNPGADAVVVAWTVASLVPNPAPTVVRGADVKEARMPADKPTLALKRYEFPGNSIRVATQYPGASPNPVSAKTDSLIYLTKGSVTFNQNGKAFEVKAGDFIREIAGLPHFWNVTGESGFVTTSGIPANAQGINASNATDIPPQPK
jgi:quercetin dioxygenase-like cupin family protein